METKSPHIGTLQEGGLHAALKRWAARPGDRLEQAVAGFVIDIVRPDGHLVEIQTANFTALRRKLARLLPEYPVHVIYPIAQLRWIIREDDAGSRISQRRSPKKGHVEDVFVELVRLPGLLAQPNLTIEVVLTHEEEMRRHDGKGSWRRRGWHIVDRRLVKVVDSVTFSALADYCRLLPANLPAKFTNNELAEQLRRPRSLAQKMTYTLRAAGCLQIVGKSGRSNLHTLVKQP